jgi:hypothetical protein
MNAKRGPTARTDRERARARQKFLKRLAETCNVSEASRVAGIARSTAHDWRGANGEFAKAWDEAIEQARDALEAEARRRAVEGWNEPVYQQGKKVGTIRRYSDRMLEVLLKGHRPQFRDKGVEVDVGVKVEPAQSMLEVARKMLCPSAHAEPSSTRSEQGSGCDSRGS